jgi:cytoplasmic iron level regulating protein YaaA (DUF328/UPF0246 family)
MLIVISPAKKLDFDRPLPAALAAAGAPSEPVFAADAARLGRAARALAPEGLQRLMGISPALAALNHARFQAFGRADAPRRPAALAFAGDTYLGLEAASLDAGEWAWAQDRLRILSGLYGLLRPLDAIQPHRLEMGSRLRTRRAATLTGFWGERIARRLAAEAAALGSDTLLNCASAEYFAAVPLPALGLRVVTPVFLEARDGRTGIVSFHAKRARGAMARFVVQHRLTVPEAIRDFDTAGYRFSAALSEGDRWAFVREAPAAA